MGTRGVYGFRKNGKDKLTYNHMDSYFSYLGRDIINFVKETPIEELHKIYDNLILVKESDIPTKEQWEHLNKCGIEKPEKSVYTLEKKENDIIDWYSALREFQGDLCIYKSGLKYMTNSNDFIKYSLFCEYGYIINLDNNSLEFWIGFQRRPQKNNRYGTTKYEGYYPCKLLHKVSISKIKSKNVNELIMFLEKKECFI